MAASVAEGPPSKHHDQVPQGTSVAVWLRLPRQDRMLYRHVAWDNARDIITGPNTTSNNSNSRPFIKARDSVEIALRT